MCKISLFLSPCQDSWREENEENEGEGRRELLCVVRNWCLNRHKTVFKSISLLFFSLGGRGHFQQLVAVQMAKHRSRARSRSNLTFVMPRIKTENKKTKNFQLIFLWYIPLITELWWNRMVHCQPYGFPIMCTIFQHKKEKKRKAFRILLTFST